MCLSDGLGRRLIRQDTGYVNSCFEELDVYYSVKRG